MLVLPSLTYSPGLGDRNRAPTACRPISRRPGRCTSPCICSHADWYVLLTHLPQSVICELPAHTLFDYQLGHNDDSLWTAVLARRHDSASAVRRTLLHSLPHAIRKASAAHERVHLALKLGSELAEDDDQNVRQAAANSLTAVLLTFHDKVITDPLLVCPLQQHVGAIQGELRGDCGVRNSAVAESATHALALISKLARDHDWEVKRSAFIGIGLMHMRCSACFQTCKGLAMVIEGLDDEDRPVRVEARRLALAIGGEVGKRATTSEPPPAPDRPWDDVLLKAHPKRPLADGWLSEEDSMGETNAPGCY